MRLRSALLVATVLAVPLAAKAQPIDGLYVGAGAGVNLKQTQAWDSFSANVGPLDPANTGGLGLKQKYNPGFVALGSVGYGLGNGLRFEVEGNYRQNNLGTLHGTA